MKAFSDDCKILQKPAFRCLSCLFAVRNRSLAVLLIEMSEKNNSYLTSAYLFLAAVSSCFTARL